MSRKANQNLWPTEYQLDLYDELNKAKQPRGGRRGKKPMVTFFPLMEQAMGFNQPHKAKTVAYLLTCASLEVTPVRRYPGWILSKTYDLKNRPLNLG